MADRLTATTLPRWRAAKLAEQDGLCAVCSTPITDKDPAVADHDHTTGQMRGVLHRSCNSLAGVIENNRVRYGLRSPVQFYKFLTGLYAYLHVKRPDDTPFYPTHRTQDEKRLLRNTRARRARAAIKKGA